MNDEYFVFPVKINFFKTLFEYYFAAVLFKKLYYPFFYPSPKRINPSPPSILWISAIPTFSSEFRSSCDFMYQLLP